jgi:hypothetical protein
MRNWNVERERLEFTGFYTANRDDCLRIVLVSVGDRQLAACGTRGGVSPGAG